MLVITDIDCLETLPDAVKPREHGVDTFQNAFVSLGHFIIYIQDFRVSFWSPPLSFVKNMYCLNEFDR